MSRTYSSVLPQKYRSRFTEDLQAGTNPEDTENLYVSPDKEQVRKIFENVVTAMFQDLSDIHYDKTSDRPDERPVQDRPVERTFIKKKVQARTKEARESPRGRERVVVNIMEKNAQYAIVSGTNHTTDNCT